MNDAPERPSQLESLRARGIRPVKRRGQNFLIDGNLARAIAADVLELGADVLELGAGGGALTFPLLELGARVTAVEVDRQLCTLLREETAGMDGFRLHEGDIARLDWDALLELTGPRPVVAGNLPYVLTSEVLFAVADRRDRVAGGVFMVQREVAERMTATPGGRDYGVLAVVLGALFEIELVRTVQASVFWPRPDVVSAVVRMRPRAETWQAAEYVRFKRLVRGLFQQRRKRVVKLLRGLYAAEEAVVRDWLDTAGIDPGLRPEQISRDRLRVLARTITAEEDA